MNLSLKYAPVNNGIINNPYIPARRFQTIDATTRNLHKFICNGISYYFSDQESIFKES